MPGNVVPALIPFSVLDLAFVTEGSTPREALSRTLDLAQHAERWGYRRFWIAEHHKNLVTETGADELMIVSPIYDHAARLHSYELFSEIQRAP